MCSQCEILYRSNIENRSLLGTCIKNLKFCALKYTCTSRRKNFTRGNHEKVLVRLCSSKNKIKISNRKIVSDFHIKRILEEYNLMKEDVKIF